MSLIPPTLAELLGASWQAGAAVVGLAWDGTGSHAGFALDDGCIAAMPGAWPGAAVVKPRPSGGLELEPASADPREPVRREIHSGSCSHIVTDPAGGWLSGGADGRLIRSDAEGRVRRIGAIDTQGHRMIVAAARGERRAAAAAAMVQQFGPEPRTERLAADVHALRFDPSGLHLAIGHDAGVVVLTAQVRAPRALNDGARFSDLAWGADGDMLVGASAEAGLWRWDMPSGAAARTAAPGPSGSWHAMSLSADGRLLAQAGGVRVVLWDMARLDAAPVFCGLDGRVAVTAVAFCPRRPVVAAGYANGAVLLAPPTGSDTLVVRGPIGGAVKTIAWSPDGCRIAFGDDAGLCVVVDLPDGLFRKGTTSARTPALAAARGMRMAS